MQTLELHLFGLPQIRVGGEPVQGLLANKVCALLFYLAVNGQPYPREALTLLFWPESPQAQGQRNLRELLYTARQWLRPYLTVTRQTIAFNQASDHQLDVQLFRQGIHQALAACDYPTLQQMTELYRLRTCHPCASEAEPPAWAVKPWPVPDGQPFARGLPNLPRVSLIPA